MNFPIIETLVFILLLAVAVYKNYRDKKALYKMNIYMAIFILVYIIILIRSC